MQDLIIDSVNTIRHLDTTIHIALLHWKTSQIKNTTNILHKRQLHIIKQIRAKLIKITNNYEST